MNIITVHVSISAYMSGRALALWCPEILFSNFSVKVLEKLPFLWDSHTKILISKSSAVTKILAILFFDFSNSEYYLTYL